MDVLFFPDNKLGVTVCPIYNGHTAIVSQNTDRLKDGQYAAAEIGLFKHNVQGTSFLNPDAVTDGENADYAGTLQSVGGTGRISFGMYYRTDRWANPITGLRQAIPDYNQTSWTEAGAAVFSGAVVGEAKPIRYPNHGQQMYDISNGELGYDSVTRQFGASGASETLVHTERQISRLQEASGRRTSSASYANGRPEASLLIQPYLLSGRNSSYSYSGDGLITYAGLSRHDFMSRPSTTRAWDAVRTGQFPDQSASLAYMQSQIGRAVSEGGWFSDFMHWHSLYDLSDVEFFDTFYAAIDSGIGAADVWRAGNDEATEYFWLRESIDKVGSFVHSNEVYVFVRLRDGQADSNTDGIPNAIHVSLIQTPLSVEIDLSSTPLAGKDIWCDRAASIRSLGTNKWVVNVILGEITREGYYKLRVFESEHGNFYVSDRPTITPTSSGFSANMHCKWVVWGHASSGTIADAQEVLRESELSVNLSFAPLSGMVYYIGAISASRQSALIEVAT